MKASDWISVEERLPELFKDVLVYYLLAEDDRDETMEGMGSTYWIDTGYREGSEKNWSWVLLGSSQLPTHWQPLPAPPQPAEGNEP